MIKKLSSFLVQIASPGFIPDYLAIFLSYLMILLIFPLDVVTGSKVTLRLIYVFPLTLIALHCSRQAFVTGALVMSVVVQVVTLMSFTDDTFETKFFLFVIILLSDSILVLVSRFARFNIIEAKRLSTTDPLTRLNNRRALEDAIFAESTRQKRYGGIFSLVLIDLDGFKGVNDTMGHQAGDMALVLMAEILLSHTRKSDMVFRIGGDEFVVLMPNTEVDDCERICTGLCHLIADRMSKASYAITASIGYTTIDRTPAASVDVLTIADKAMYQAKTSGKSRVVRGYDTSNGSDAGTVPT
jgi:diguanylate cyclase (GGDEF)-like protein